MSYWKKVETSFLKERERTNYLKREKALTMASELCTYKEIEKETGYSRQEVHRFIKRCLSVDSNGNYLGFVGLIKYRRVISDQHASSHKLSEHRPPPGVLKAFFIKYPSIETKLFNFSVHGKIEGLRKVEINPPHSAIQRLFEDLCEKAGIKAPHYPFNSASCGRWSIRRWVNKQRSTHAISVLKTSDSHAAVSLAVTGSALHSSMPINRYYQRVQCDGHKIDYECTIELRIDDSENVIYKRIKRIWIIAIVDVKSHAILGYSIALGENYSAQDIIQALKNSVVPWKPRKLTVKNIQYGDGDGLPNGVIEGLAYARFDEIQFDNASAHLSDQFLTYLDRLIGATPIFTPTASPNANAIVEGFFHILEEASIHRMPGTTGSHINDPRGKQQDIDDKDRLPLDLLEDLIDLTVARINGTRSPDSSLTRLEVLRRSVARRSCIYRLIPKHEREDLLRHDYFEMRKIATDNQSIGIRLHGDFYRNDVLKTAKLLVGRSVFIMANSQDLRTIECILDDGTHLGILHGRRKWRYTPHSLRTKLEINRLAGLGVDLSGDDLPLAFRRYLEQQAKTSKRDASKLARVRKEQSKAATIPNQEINKDEEVPEMFELIVDKPDSVLQIMNLVEDEDYEHDALGFEKSLSNIRTVYR